MTSRRTPEEQGAMGDPPDRAPDRPGHPPGTAADESGGFTGSIVDEWGRQSFPASDPPANW